MEKFFNNSNNHVNIKNTKSLLQQVCFHNKYRHSNHKNRLHMQSLRLAQETYFNLTNMSIKSLVCNINLIIMILTSYSTIWKPTTNGNITFVSSLFVKCSFKSSQAGPHIKGDSKLWAVLSRIVRYYSRSLRTMLRWSAAYSSSF